jgi:mRNA interferase YafQ
MLDKVYTKKFQKSLKKVLRSGKIKRKEVEDAITILASGATLGKTYKDHQLHGKKESYRECHIRGDLLLVYQIKNEELVIVLADIGTHSYLDL